MPASNTIARNDANRIRAKQRRLEEQRRAGVELVERAYEAQVRALELVWMLQGGAGTLPLPVATVAAAPSPLPPPVSPQKPRHKLGAEVMTDVHAKLPELPEVFTQHDLCQALGYQPDRAVLYRVLRSLLRDETLLIESYGFRRRPTSYRKAGAERSPESAGGLESS
jgi:hypothetical protein